MVIKMNEKDEWWQEVTQRKKDREGLYDAPKRNTGKCVVRRCEAESCIHNENLNCQLNNIEVDKQGRCKQFKPGKRQAISRSKPSGGTPWKKKHSPIREQSIDEVNPLDRKHPDSPIRERKPVRN
jgi:hypothetical protein